MLEVTDLYAGYGGFQVLQGMTLTVGAGELVALLGAKGVDLLFSNEAEALSFAGTTDLMVAREALKKVAKTFIITRGEKGALIFDGTTFIDIAAFPVKAIDSNGAGDMFAGAFLYAITHGHNFAEAGKLASASASKVVSQYGPRLKWHQTQEVLHHIFPQR